MDAETANEPATIKRRVMIGTLWLTGWRMLTRGLGFVSMLALTQLLVPADFGLMALASAAAAAVESLSQIGVRDALIRLEGNAEEHFDAAFTMQAGRGLLTGAVLALGSPLMAEWMGDPRLQPIMVALGFLAFVGALENVGTVTLARRLDFRSQVLLQAAPRVAGVIITILLALWLHSYWALIAGLAFARFAGTAASYALAPHIPRPSLHGWRYLTHFSAWSWAGSIAVLIWSKSDPFLLGPAVGTAALGTYVIAMEIALLPLTELIEPVSAALYSGFSVAHRSGTLKKGAATTIATAISICIAPVALGLSATSGYLVEGVLGPKWVTDQPIIAVLAFVCVVSPFSYVCGTTLAALGHVRRAFYCNAIAAGIKVSSTLATLAVTHDLRAIAGLTIVTVAAEAALFVWQTNKVDPQKLSDIGGPLLRAAIAGTITATILAAIQGTWEPSQLGRLRALLIGAPIGLATIVLHGCFHLAIWHAAGRPPGAEKTLRDLAEKVVAKVMTGLRNRRATS